MNIKSLRRKARELGLELEEEDFQDMIALADQDKDGFINEEEFYQFISLTKVYWTNAKFQTCLLFHFIYV